MVAVECVTVIQNSPLCKVKRRSNQPTLKLFSTTQKSTAISCQTADRNTEISSPQYSIAWLKSDSSKTAVQKEKACSTGLFNGKGKTGINNHPARRHPIVLLPSEQAQRYRHILL